MLLPNPVESNPPTITTLAAAEPPTESEPPQSGSEGPGSAGKQPGGTEAVPAGGVGAAGRAVPSSDRLCAANPSPMHPTKPSRKCTPAQRLCAIWGRPPLLIGGPETQMGEHSQLEAVSVGVDWLNATGDLAALEPVRRLVASLWSAEMVPEDCPPRQQYGARLRYPNGVEVNYTPEGAPGTEGLWLSVPGSALGELDPDAQYRLIYNAIRLGLRATRLDLALDTLWAEPSEILDAIYDGSRGLEYVDPEKKKRRVDYDRVAWQPEAMGFQTMTQADGYKRGRRQGRSIYFGSRGKSGGGQQCCIYDKGREQKLAEPGRWIRQEARFYKRGEMANQVMERLAESPDGWRHIALAIVIQQVDFREANGRRERERRPRCEWWSSFIRDVRYKATAALVPQRKTARLAKTMDWMQTSVMPTAAEVAVAIADIMGQDFTLGQFVEGFFGKDRIKNKQRRDAIHDDVRKALAGSWIVDPLTALANGLLRGPPDAIG